MALAILSGLLAFGNSNLVSKENTLIIVSIVGALMTIIFFLISNKYAVLIQRERGRARASGQLLESLGDGTIVTVDAENHKANSKKGLSKIKLRLLWNLYYIAFLFGFIVLIFKWVLP